MNEDKISSNILISCDQEQNYLERGKAIAILGGGLTGLTLGYLLNIKNINFEILEKESECGGLMRTLQENNFTFDYRGSHIIFSKDKEVLNFMLTLLGDNKIKNRRNTIFFYKWHYVKYPFENGLADLPKQDNFECLYYFVQNLIEKEKGNVKKPKNLKKWLYHTFGKGIAERYLIPYNKKIWNYPTEKIGLDLVERIPNPPVEDIIKSSLGIESEGYTHQLYFYYPKVGGIQALIKSLEERIKNHIVENFEVKKVKKEDGEWIISSRKEEKAYSKIISTIPIFDLVKAINAPKEIKKTVNTLKYNSLITLMIGLDKSKINDFTWLYIPDEDVLTHRVSFPSNYSSNMAPEKRSSVLAEITCNIGDEIWKMNDEEILERTIEDLYRLKIIDKEKVCFTAVKKLKYAYVINNLEYNENIRKIKEFMKEAEVDIIGRFAEFKYLNMDECIRGGIKFFPKFEMSRIKKSQSREKGQEIKS